MTKVAVVGLGWWGRHIARALHQRGETLVPVRVVDPRPEATAEVTREVPVASSSGLDEALDDPEVEAVVLATPHALHEAQVVRAAASGRHVFCEKPLALTRASAERCVDACVAAGVALGVGHERRWEPAFVEIADLVARGALGTLMHVESHFSHDRLAGLGPDDWRVSREHGPSVAMTGMSIHLTDAYINLFGPIVRVFARRTRRVVGYETGDVIAAQVDFASGLTGSFTSIVATPFYSRFRVFGAAAWVEAADSAHTDDPAAESRITVCGSGEEPRTRRLPQVDTVLANLDAFAAAASGGAEYPITHAQMIENVATLEAIGRSLDSGAPESVG